MSQRFDQVEEPRRLEREVNTGSHREAPSRAVFSNVTIDQDLFPEAKLIFIEHATRDLLWRPEWMEHPNGAISLEEVALCVDDVDVVAAKFSRLFDLRPNFPMADVALFKLSEGKVYIVNLAALAKWAPGVVPPAVPSVFGVGFSVRDLNATKELLNTNGVDYQSHQYPGIWIRPEITGGAVVSFM